MSEGFAIGQLIGSFALLALIVWFLDELSNKRKAARVMVKLSKTGK